MTDQDLPAEAGTYGTRPPGYRLPEGMSLGAVHLLVSDLARSIAYYRDVLGFRVLRETSDRAMLATQGDDTPLIVLEHRPGVTPLSRPTLGLYHFAILLPNRESLGRLIAHLARLRMRVGMADHAVSEAIYLRDPDGLGIEVYADRPRTTWRRRGEELFITTESLDVQHLVAAGGDTPWSGMPAGTKIGHVHLHVGDLAEGERFFHGALGMDKIAWSYPGALFLSAGGYHHHLGTNTWALGASSAQPTDAQLVEWTIELPNDADVNDVAESLRAAGHEVRDEGRSRLVTDPWGTAIRIVAR
jgi:catechol 2,3-dioxygenase